MRGRYYWGLMIVTVIGLLVAVTWIYDKNYRLKIFPNLGGGYVVLIQADHIRKCDVSGNVTVCYQGWDLKENRPK